MGEYVDVAAKTEKDAAELQEKMSQGSDELMPFPCQVVEPTLFPGVRQIYKAKPKD